MRYTTPGRSLVAVAVSLLALAACEGATGPVGPMGPQGPAGPQGPVGPQGPFDKIVRLPFFTAGVSHSASNPEANTCLRESTHIIKFNRRDYAGVDSVIFIASLSSSTSSARAIADVFNLTDGVVVTRSQVQTTSTSATWVESGNLFGGLPDKEITLCIRLRPETSGAVASVHSGSLLLYRR